MNDLDLRLHAVRDDLADRRLAQTVERPAYTDPVPYFVAAPTVQCYKTPGATAIETEFLFGEPLDVFFGRTPDPNGAGDPESDWWWVQSAADRYVGYVAAGALRPGRLHATHRISVPRALVFEAPNIRARLACTLPLSARVRVGETIHGKETFHRLSSGGFVLDQHVRSVGTSPGDFVALAETYVGTPYLWGGKTWEGLDCSGLVQLSIEATGGAAPRDSDMQAELIGERLPPDAALERGDVVFWRGHVGIMLDDTRLLHANGFHMMTVVEPLAEARDRLGAHGLPVTAIRRMISKPAAKGSAWTTRTPTPSPMCG